MPTYAYSCRACGKHFSVIATLAEKETGTAEKFHCPACHSKNTRAHFSPGNFLRNVFGAAGADAGGCCSGGDVCDISCKPDKNGKSNCDAKNSNGGCCG